MTRNLTMHEAEVRQRSLDAALPLQLARQRVLRFIDERGRSSRCDVEVVAIGIQNIRRALVRRGAVCQELLATAPSPSLEALAYSHEEDQKSTARGNRMKGLFDLRGSPPEVREYLAATRQLDFYFSSAPVQMKIINRRQVVVEGPLIDGERTALAVSQTEILNAAWHYWWVVNADAVPATAIVHDDPVARFTPRQREIAHLMADDLSDEVIAARLQVSVRTVRYEVAAIMRLLGARSRFGAGLKLGQLGFEHLNSHASPAAPDDVWRSVAERVEDLSGVQPAFSGAISAGRPNLTPVRRQAPPLPYYRVDTA